MNTGFLVGITGMAAIEYGYLRRIYDLATKTKNLAVPPTFFERLRGHLGTDVGDAEHWCRENPRLLPALLSAGMLESIALRLPDARIAKNERLRFQYELRVAPVEQWVAKEWIVGILTHASALAITGVLLAIFHASNDQIRIPLLCAWILAGGATIACATVKRNFRRNLAASRAGLAELAEKMNNWLA